MIPQTQEYLAKPAQFNGVLEKFICGCIWEIYLCKVYFGDSGMCACILGFVMYSLLLFLLAPNCLSPSHYWIEEVLYRWSLFVSREGILELLVDVSARWAISFYRSLILGYLFDTSNFVVCRSRSKQVLLPSCAHY